MNKKKAEILFPIILLVITIIIVERSMRYNLKSYLLPLIVAIPVGTLTLVQIVKAAFSQDSPPPVAAADARRNGMFAGFSLVALIAFIYLAGFLVAIPAGVFAYILYSREKWYLALGLGLAMLLVLSVLQILGLYLYEGILLS